MVEAHIRFSELRKVRLNTWIQNFWSGLVAEWCHSKVQQIVAEHTSLSISSLNETVGLPCQMASLA